MKTSISYSSSALIVEVYEILLISYNSAMILLYDRLLPIEKQKIDTLYCTGPVIAWPGPSGIMSTSCLRFLWEALPPSGTTLCYYCLEDCITDNQPSPGHGLHKLLIVSHLTFCFQSSGLMANIEMIKWKPAENTYIDCLT